MIVDSAGGNDDDSVRSGRRCLNLSLEFLQQYLAGAHNVHIRGHGGGAVRVFDNPALSDRSLPGLTSIGHYVNIDNNDALALRDDSGHGELRCDLSW